MRKQYKAKYNTNQERKKIRENGNKNKYTRNNKKKIQYK